jgi:hypothetical protein
MRRLTADSVEVADLLPGHAVLVAEAGDQGAFGVVEFLARVEA